MLLKYCASACTLLRTSSSCGCDSRCTENVVPICPMETLPGWDVFGLRDHDQPGIGPGSRPWQGRILTTRLRSLALTRGWREQECHLHFVQWHGFAVYLQFPNKPHYLKNYFDNNSFKRKLVGREIHMFSYLFTYSFNLVANTKNVK